MKRIVLKVLAASLLAGIAGTALAEARGSAGITKVSYTLIDLTPDDGVAPSIQFNDNEFGSVVYGEVRGVTQNEEFFREYLRSGLAPLSPVAGSGSTSMSWASGSATGGTPLGFATMDAAGYALSGTESHGTFYSIVQSPLSLFSLSANTAVRFSVEGWAAGETTIGKDSSGVFDEWGGGVLRLEAGGDDGTGTGDLVMDRTEAYAAGTWAIDALGNVSGTKDSWAGLLSVMYSNNTDHALDGMFGAEITASGYSVASPVPEPAEYGMLLAGLGLIGFVGRRRARSGQQGPGATAAEGAMPRLAHPADTGRASHVACQPYRSTMQRLALPLVAAATLGLGASGMAHAGANSSLSLNNIVITLTDLDLNDGVTPWITSMHMSQPYLNGGAGSLDPGLTRDAFAALGKRDTSVLNGLAEVPYAGSQASIHGASTIVGFESIDLGGYAGSGPNAMGEYGAYAASYTPMNFNISANTAVTISFNTTIAVSTTLGYNPSTGLDEFAAGRVLFYFSGLDGNGQGQIVEQYKEVTAGYQLDANGQYSGESNYWSGELSLTFSNLLAHEAVATLNAEAGINGYSVSAVPEPAEYGMLLAGLGLIGCVARRRKQA